MFMEGQKEIQNIQFEETKNTSDSEGCSQGKTGREASCPEISILKKPRRRYPQGKTPSN